MSVARIIFRRSLDSIQSPFPLRVNVSLHEALTDVLSVRVKPFERHIIFPEGSGRIPDSQRLTVSLSDTLDGLYSPILWKEIPEYFETLREKFGSDDCVPCDLGYDGAELIARASVRSLVLYTHSFNRMGYTELSEKFLTLLLAMQNEKEIVLGDRDGCQSWVVMAQKQ